MVSISVVSNSNVFNKTIIMSYITNRLDKPLVVNSIASLSSGLPEPFDGQLVETLGYYSPGDGGGNLYRYDASSSALVDWGHTFDGLGGDNSTVTLQAAKTTAGTGTGRFIAVDTRDFNLDRWGAVNDSSSECFFRIQAALDKASSNGGGHLHSNGRETGSYYINDTLTFGSDISFNLNKVSLIQTTDNIPIIELDSGGSTTVNVHIEDSYFSYANFQPGANTNARGIVLATGGTISLSSSIKNCRIARGYNGICLPTDGTISAFLWVFENIRITDCSSYGFFFDGAGAGTNLLLKGVYCQNASFTSETAGMKGFFCNGVKGLSIDDCGMDGTRSWPVFNIRSSHGTATNMFMEQAVVSSPNTAAFLFDDTDMNIGSIYTFGTDATIDTGLGATVRAISVTGTNVRIANLLDKNITITDNNPSDNYYSVLTDKVATTKLVVEKYEYNALGSNPNQGFAEFNNDQRILTNTWEYNGNVRREEKGGRHHAYGTAAPTTNTWSVGDIIWNVSPTAGGNIGWACTTAGTPGTWTEIELGSGGSASRKANTDDLATASGTLAIDFDSANYDNKKVTLTADTQFSLTATRSSVYNLHLLSDAASFRAVTWTDTFSGTPPVSVNDTTGIVLQLYYDASADIWHVY